MSIIIWEMTLRDKYYYELEEKHYFLFRWRLERFYKKNEKRLKYYDVTIGGIQLWI